MLLLAPDRLLGQRQVEPRPAPLSREESLRLGRELVADLLAQRPDKDLANSGVLRVRDARDRERRVPVKFATYSTPTNWISVYETAPAGSGEKVERLTVIHHADKPNEYLLTAGTASAGAATNPVTLPGNQLMTPFVGSDFWVADLGLEFLHWPQQRVLRKEIRHSLSCAVLESIHPQAGSQGYSRVVSWVDTESGGIVHADAYDAQGALLKEFDPTGLKKVNGRRQLEGMEMRNPQTRSHTWIKFDVIEER